MSIVPPPTRRHFIQGAGLAMATPFLSGSALGRTRSAPVVDIANGKLRGLSAGGAVSFKGIPYADDTAAGNRFMAPRPVRNWAGIRDASKFGDRCTQETGGVETLSRPGDWFSWYATPGTYSENCCVLNVYTRNLDRNARRPVMVYIHGGGFRSGSGDGPALEGSNLARLGDVVVVTVNHRLNLFGYLPLGHLDPDFADSANAGQLDLIAALRWVQTNIAEFGGDPGRVLLFGQSGGGSKIATLMIMPGAQGLLHRAVNMSGPTAYAMGKAEAKEPVVDLFLRNLGIGRADLRRLQTLPPAQLHAAHKQAVSALGADDYRPVIDGRHIPFGPLTPEGVAIHAAVPMMMGTTETETTLWLGRDQRNVNASAAQVTDRIARQFGMDGNKAAAIYAAYEGEVPGRTPYDIVSALSTDLVFRARMLGGAEAKAAAGRAPVYLYNFNWQIPVDGGIWKSPHTADIPFAFANVDRVRVMTGGDKAALQVSRRLMSAFVAFARTGNPDNRLMPHWPAYDTARRTTMVIGNASKAVDDYLGNSRKAAQPLLVQQAYQIQAGPLMRAVGV